MFLEYITLVNSWSILRVSRVRSTVCITPRECFGWLLTLHSGNWVVNSKCRCFGQVRSGAKQTKQHTTFAVDDSTHRLRTQRNLLTDRSGVFCTVHGQYCGMGRAYQPTKGELQAVGCGHCANKAVASDRFLACNVPCTSAPIVDLWVDFVARQGICTVLLVLYSKLVESGTI